MTLRNRPRMIAYCNLCGLPQEIPYRSNRAPIFACGHCVNEHWEAISEIQNWIEGYGIHRIANVRDALDATIERLSS